MELWIVLNGVDEALLFLSEEEPRPGEGNALDQAREEVVALVGFGTFTVRERAARTGRNPQTGAEIQIKAAKVPAFKPGKALKDALNS